METSTSGKTAFAVASKLISLAAAAVNNSQPQLLPPVLLLGIFSFLLLAVTSCFRRSLTSPVPRAPPSRKEAQISGNAFSFPVAGLMSGVEKLEGSGYATACKVWNNKRQINLFFFLLLFACKCFFFLATKTLGSSCHHQISHHFFFAKLSVLPVLVLVLQLADNTVIRLQHQ